MIAHIRQPFNQLAQAVGQLFARPTLYSAPAPLSVGPIPIGPTDCFRAQPLALPDQPLPEFVASCPVAQKYLALLGLLDWSNFPERSCQQAFPGPLPHPRASFVAAYLLKLNEQLSSMGRLRAFLIDHPALLWLFGFSLIGDPTAPLGFDVTKSAPSRRQFNRVLSSLSNDACQFLLDSSVTLIVQHLPAELAASFGDVIAGDTKHILAWVKQNNPKQFVEHRFDKERQPKGDKDCKLGVKKRKNRSPDAPPAAPPTPTNDAVAPSHKRGDAEFYWGYASGVVATSIPQLGEVVLAERTRPFNEGDVTYFTPLMEMVERRLGRRPRFGAWDAAYDAHYVYEYFHQAGGFAAVPMVVNPQHGVRSFSEDGRPLCAAGLAMPRRLLYWDRTSTMVPEQREQCVCPLLHPQPTGQACPINDPHFAKGGCKTTIAAGVGSRIRHTLDRKSEEYRRVFKLRTVCERVNSQAVAHGIERPKLRNQRSIANANTLLYVLLNLQTLQRLKQRLAERQEISETLAE